MNRTIRPVGKVSTALGRHGYRQQAAVFVDGEQLQHVAILSKQVGDKIKFEGHWIDGNGELHKTTAFVDMKKAAARILKIREQELEEHPPAAAKKAATRQPASKKPAPRNRTDDSKLIDCKGCNTVHRDDTLCPW